MTESGHVSGNPAAVERAQAMIAIHGDNAKLAHDVLDLAARLSRAEAALQDLADADGITKPTWANPWMRARAALEAVSG